MIYYVTALQNDKSKIFVKNMQTTDKDLACHAEKTWKSEGYIIVKRQEL